MPQEARWVPPDCTLGASGTMGATRGAMGVPRSTLGVHHRLVLPVGQQQQCCSRCNKILRGNPGQRGPGGGGPSKCQSLKQNDHPESTQEQQVPQHVWQESNGRFASFPTDKIWTISYGMMDAAGGALGAPRLHVGCNQARWVPQEA